MVLTKSDIIACLASTPPLIENFVDSDVQVQPNGVDFTVKSIASFGGPARIGFSDTDRLLPTLTVCEFDPNGWARLGSGSYLVDFNETVNLPNNIAAIGKPRSSLLRIGATIETAIWDAGYHGKSRSLLLVLNPEGIEIARDARIMQLMFMRLSRETEGYSGVYQ